MKLTVRTRLTAAYAVLFCLSTGLVLLLSWVLLDRHFERTLPEPLAERDARPTSAACTCSPSRGALVLAVARRLGAGGPRARAALERITRTARRVSDERLDERIALEGPADELRELADTFDAMLDDLAESFDAQRRFVANASHELRASADRDPLRGGGHAGRPRGEPRGAARDGRGGDRGSLRTEALLEGLMALARSQRGLLRPRAGGPGAGGAVGRGDGRRGGARGGRAGADRSPSPPRPTATGG